MRMQTYTRSIISAVSLSQYVVRIKLVNFSRDPDTLPPLNSAEIGLYTGRQKLLKNSRSVWVEILNAPLVTV